MRTSSAYAVRRLAAWTMALAALPAAAQVTYTSQASGSWSDAATWSPVGGPPLAGDSAVIDAGDRVACDAAAAGSVAALTVTGAGAGLSLARDLSVSGTALIEVGAGLDLAGFALAAANLTVDDAGTSISRTGGGRLQVTGTLSVREDADLALGPDDTVVHVLVGTHQNGSGKTTTLTTAAAGNISGNVTVGAGSPLNSETLHLGADLVTAGNLVLNSAYNDGGRVQAHGHGITANAVSIYMSTPFTDRAAGGRLTVNTYTGVRGANLLTRPGDQINAGIYLNLLYNAGALIQVDQGAGDRAGLTLGSPAYPSAQLRFNHDYKGRSKMTLNFDADSSRGYAADWAFRWYGNHVASLQANYANPAGAELVVNGVDDFDPAVNIWYSDPAAEGDAYTYVGRPARPSGAMMLVR